MRTYEALGNTYTRCCATCKHWEQRQEDTTFGYCQATPMNIRVRLNATTDAVIPLPTLDLAICSKWQDKDVTE